MSTEIIDFGLQFAFAAKQTLHLALKTEENGKILCPKKLAKKAKKVLDIWGNACYYIEALARQGLRNTGKRRGCTLKIKQRET